MIHEPEKKERDLAADFLETAIPYTLRWGWEREKFITEMAKLHPDINYVGIERYTSVLLRAVQKQGRPWRKFPISVISALMPGTCL